jgi:hypothetical protein
MAKQKRCVKRRGTKKAQRRRIVQPLREIKIRLPKQMPDVPEVTLLEEGHIPPETKIGTDFKGKNQVIIAESKKKSQVS